MEWLALEHWNPYVCGAGLGVLSWLVFLLSNEYLGCSTAFAKTAGLLEKLFRGSKTLERPYYQEVKPQIDWGWLLVAGIFLGGLISSLASGSFRAVFVPELWKTEACDSVAIRAFVGLVGGCPHGLRGALGQWLHQRSRALGHDATGPQQLGGCAPLFRLRHTDGFPDDGGLSDVQKTAAKQANPAFHRPCGGPRVWDLP